MEKMRKIAGLLCAMMLLSALPGMSALGDDTVSAATLALTDASGNEVDDGVSGTAPGEITAKVTDGNGSRLIFASYDEVGRLLDVELHSVDSADYSQILDMTDADKAVREYKIFLWDGYDKLTPLSPSRSLWGGGSFWTDVWELSGVAKAYGETLVLDSAADQEASAQWNPEINNKFDISWTMAIENSNGSETVEIATGVYLVSLRISAKENMIYYETASGEEETPWEIWNDKHTYRLIRTADGSCHLWIDGAHVVEMTDAPTSSEADTIRFSNAGDGTDGSKMQIDSVAVNGFASANTPATNLTSFCDTFDDIATATTEKEKYNNLNNLGWVPGQETYTVTDETTGTTTTKTDYYDADGNLFSKWEIADGNMQSVDYKDGASVVQKNYTTTNGGDDYIFTTKLQFAEFGSQTTMVIYMGNRAINLDMREFFFGMVGENRDAGTNASVTQNRYSDPIDIDTEKWYNLRIETFDYKKNARVYLDNVKIMEADVRELSGETYAIYINCGNGSKLKMDYIKCSPVKYGITVTGLTDGATYQAGETLSLSATLNSYKSTTAAGYSGEDVTYYLSGNAVATGIEDSNYAATISELPAGTYELTAVSGPLTSAPISFTVEGAEDSGTTSNPVTASSNYANEVTYTATGDGDVEYCNGMHLVEMKHAGGKLTYTTDEGTGTYDYGTGDFHVLTEGPVADVYRNGQFVFSYYMPMQSTAISSSNGTITNYSVTTSGERQNYYSANNVTSKNTAYILNELPHNHVLDFVADSSDEVNLAVNDGYYRTNVSIENGELYVWNGQRNNSLMEKTKVATVGAEETYYRVETSAGMSRLYANGRWITTFRGAPTVGENTLSVDVTAGELSYLAVCDNGDVYLYEDDFSGNGEFASEDYWMTSNDMTASVDETNKVLSLTSTGATGIAELSPNCGTVDLSADVTINSGNGVWFIVNHVVSNTYTKVGYRKNTLFGGQYEIIDVINGVETKIASKTVYSVDFSTKHSIQVKVQESPDGDVVTLLVDGNKILSGVSQLNCRGRVGFMLATGSASLDNLAFRGDAKPLVGFTEYRVEQQAITDMMENFDTGEVYIMNSAGQGYATKDGGKTWTANEKFYETVNGAEKQTGYYWSESGKVIRIISSNCLYQFQKPETLGGTEYQKGDILAIRKIWGAKMYENSNGTGSRVEMYDELGRQLLATYAIKSHDYGENWTVNSDYLVDLKDIVYGQGATVNTLKRGASGRFYYSINAGTYGEDYGGSRIWYSDDGVNWTESSTVIDSKVLGFVHAESVVIETGNPKDGYKTRLYFRTDMGSICYLESPDRGVTWDLTPHATPFISPATCFNIEADPEDETGNTLYIAWSYDNTNLFARHQFPRTRASVAKSCDGGETWEMVGTVRENNSIFHGGTQNMNISVSSEHVYVSGYGSDEYGVTKFGSFIAAFPKDSQRTSKRFEQLHLQYPVQVENTKVMLNELKERTMAVHAESGAVWLRGERYENAVSGEYVSLDCAAALVGATVGTGTNGETVLRIGDAEVTFSSNDLNDTKDFVLLSAFAEKFGLSMVEEDGVQLVSENGDWSVRQKKAFQYAVDVFSSKP